MGPFEEDLRKISHWLKEHEFRQRRFFITGATGLIGSILVKAILYGNRLYRLENHVIALVRNEDKAKRVFCGWEDGPDLEYCVGDVLESLQYDGRVDYIIHGACETKSANMVKQPVETMWLSAAGSKNVLDFAVKKNVSGMVYLSSMEVFGNPGDAEKRVKEAQLGSLDLQNVRSCYPESKRFTETMCACYASEYGLPVVSARLAQTFGAGVPKTDTRIFAQLAKSVIAMQDIVLHTTGESYGNYVYISDAITAILTLLICGTAGEAYTVVNEETSMPIRDMAKLVAEKIAFGNIQIVYDIPADNTFGYAPTTALRLDGSKLKKLGWKPEVGLVEAYERMILDWRQGS